MNARWLLYVSLCGTQVIHAQPLLEVADQRSDLITYERVLPIGGSAWAFFGDKNDPGGVGSMDLLTARSATGDLLWSTGFTNMTYVRGDVASGPDSSILACGQWDACDFGQEHSIITRITSNGATDWSVPVALQWLKHIATNAGSLLAFATDDSVHVTDLSGDSVAQWVAPDTPIKALCWTNEGHLLIATDSTLQLVNASGLTMSTSPIAGAPVQIVARPDSRIWVLRSNELLLVSPDLQLITTFDLTPYTTNARRLGSDGNDAWVLTPTEVVHVDAELGPIGAFPIDPLPGHIVLDLAYRNGRIITAGYANLYSTRAAVMRTYDISGLSAVHDADVSIAIASVDSTWLVQSGLSNSYFLRTALTLSLTNNSASIVNDLLLSHQLGEGWFCGRIGTMRPLTQLNLQPGQTVDVPFSLTTGLPQAYPPGSTATAEVCIVAASPEHLVDREPADNEACTTVSVIGVGVPEDEADVPFRVSPNPFQQDLRLSFKQATGPVDINLHDHLGRSVLAQRIGQGSVADLHLPDLAPGLYLLTVRSEAGTHTVSLIRSADR